MMKTALSAYIVNVRGNVYLWNSRFDGAVMLGGAMIGSDLQCGSGRFINPGDFAIFAPGASIGGVLYLNKVGELNDFEANGMVSFSVDSIGNAVIMIMPGSWERGPSATALTRAAMRHAK
jgi:hypothetical protein